MASLDALTPVVRCRSFCDCRYTNIPGGDVADERAMTVARRAAELLPGPPPAHDGYGYLAWEELVLSTARRLQRLLSHETLATPPAPSLALARGTGRLDAEFLLTLSVLLVHDDDFLCARLLSDAVAAHAIAAHAAGRTAVWA